jgi:hypothetical protein
MRVEWPKAEQCSIEAAYPERVATRARRESPAVERTDVDIGRLQK